MLSILSSLLLVLLLSGCTTRNDPSFNVYAPGGGDATLLEQAEAGVNGLQWLVEDLDLRLENAVY